MSPLEIVRCNKCGWSGEEADLVMANDAEDGELTNAACPKCLTDHYLIDFPEPSPGSDEWLRLSPNFHPGDIA